MSARLPAPPAPGPLEAYAAAAFDPCFAVLAQRCGFREYLQGLLLPRDRNKTLTALAGAEPIVQAQAAPVQRLQSFLSESTWNPEVVQQQRLAILLTDGCQNPAYGRAGPRQRIGDRSPQSFAAAGDEGGPALEAEWILGQLCCPPLHARKNARGMVPGARTILLNVTLLNSGEVSPARACGARVGPVPQVSDSLSLCLRRTPASVHCPSSTK